LETIQLESFLFGIGKFYVKSGVAAGDSTFALVFADKIDQIDVPSEDHEDFPLFDSGRRI